MTEFAIATSWDDNELLVRLHKLNQQYKQKDRRVTEIFGSLKTGITGSGRPAYRLPDVSWKQMIKHVRDAHKYGIRFNYTMNAPDFGGREADKSWVKEVVEFIARLDEEAGVDCLTITHPFLIGLVKEKFPRLGVYLSLIAGVDTVEQAKKHEDMGVDVIHLSPFTINRDFKMIKQIVGALDIPVVLYANIPCLSHCPWRDAHYKFFGYASQSGDKHITTRFDPYIAKCSLEYLNDPIRLPASPFIRPEDIREYEQIGVKHFKLSDRSESTDFLVYTAEAYLNIEYHGDLFKLIFRSGSKFKTGIKSLYPEVADFDIPIAIYNDALTGMDFIGNIKRLHGQELLDFYGEVVDRCMVIEQTEQLNKLKGYLKIISRKRRNL